MKRKWIWFLPIVVLAILHQDNWWWKSTHLVAGFVPIGLAWHAMISLGAGLGWWLVILFADSDRVRFEYRDSLWHGADMLGVGVASFSHIQGVHYQNTDQWEVYRSRLEAGELPLSRALVPTPHQRLIREWILQLKMGRVDTGPLSAKYDTDVLAEFGEPLEQLANQGLLTVQGQIVELTRAGLLQVDGLLPLFFEAPHRNVRYT